jgi:hypothetical protein
MCICWPSLGVGADSKLLLLLLLVLQVDESMRACAGGGTMAAKERVEALSLPVTAVDAFVTDDSLAKTPGLCFGLLWGRQWLQQQQQQQQPQL